MTASGHGMDVWSSSAWRQLAVSWLDSQLAAVGSRRTGDVEQLQLRPWATVLKAPTTGGTVWLRACGPATVFEVALYQLIYCADPEHVLRPIMTDLSRGWMLLPDGGPSLGDQLTGAGLADAMEATDSCSARSPHAQQTCWHLALQTWDLRSCPGASRKPFWPWAQIPQSAATPLNGQPLSVCLA